jgi:hypothetical protein
MDDLTHEIRLLRLLVVASILFSLSLGGAIILANGDQEFCGPSDPSSARYRRSGRSTPVGYQQPGRAARFGDRRQTAPSER